MVTRGATRQPLAAAVALPAHEESASTLDAPWSSAEAALVAETLHSLSYGPLSPALVGELASQLSSPLAELFTHFPARSTIPLAVSALASSLLLEAPFRTLAVTAPSSFITELRTRVKDLFVVPSLRAGDALLPSVLDAEWRIGGLDLLVSVSPGHLGDLALPLCAEYAGAATCSFVPFSFFAHAEPARLAYLCSRAAERLLHLHPVWDPTASAVGGVWVILFASAASRRRLLRPDVVLSSTLAMPAPCLG
jgi:hypothetical protein